MPTRASKHRRAGGRRGFTQSPGTPSAPRDGQTQAQAFIHWVPPLCWALLPQSLRQGPACRGRCPQTGLAPPRAGRARAGRACFQARHATAWEPSSAQGHPMSHGPPLPPLHMSQHGHGWAPQRREDASDTAMFQKEPPRTGMREECGRSHKHSWGLAPPGCKFNVRHLGRVGARRRCEVRPARAETRETLVERTGGGCPDGARREGKREGA